LEIKKQHVSAYHWPSSGFTLEAMLQDCYTIIANYCKLLVVLLTVITLPTITVRNIAYKRFSTHS